MPRALLSSSYPTEQDVRHDNDAGVYAAGASA